ncbi:MAG: DUF6010 family protein [Gemmatimonadales bacterium]|nr:DUF6010 family protein [Gemmatimonadales bacterium]
MRMLWGAAATVAGLALGELALRVLARRPPAVRRAVLAGLLALASVVYVGFAMRLGRPSQRLPELFGLAGFAALALVGLDPAQGRILALAWLGHALWDLTVPFRGGGSYVPDWYPPFCLAFDLLLAVGIWRAARPAGGAT